MLAPISVALFALAIRAILLFWLPPPLPAIPDEFSNLLLGDTLASGRLANPQHAMWVHFETLHVISHPSYASKYPPLQGAFLAAGQCLFGHPWFGVLLSTALMCGLLCWAIQGWLPPVWGLVGSLLATVHIGIVSYWTESYWGGGHAALAGALVLGAVPRLMRWPRWPAALAYAGGMALLANSRPYEGAVLGLLTGALLAYRFWRHPRVRPAELLRQVGLPLAAVLIPTVLWMGYYNRRLTRDPLTLPYVLHERQYAMWSMFVWSGPRPQPEYNHDSLRAHWVDFDTAMQKEGREHFWAVHRIDVLRLAAFYLGLPLMAFVAISLPSLFRCGRMRLPLILLCLFYCCIALLSRFYPHYFAPATALVYVVAAGTVRLAWARRRSRDLVSVFLLAVLALAGARISAPEGRMLFDHRKFAAERDRVVRQLRALPGGQLVIVRYGPNHDINEEWVFNGADIDHSRIVWAHYMGPQKDRELLQYFPNRRAWLLEENDGITLREYPVARSPEAAAQCPACTRMPFSDSDLLNAGHLYP